MVAVHAQETLRIQWSCLCYSKQNGYYFPFKFLKKDFKRAKGFLVVSDANLSHKKPQTPVILTAYCSFMGPSDEKLIYIYLNSQNICKL